MSEEVLPPVRRAPERDEAIAGSREDEFTLTDPASAQGQRRGGENVRLVSELRPSAWSIQLANAVAVSRPLPEDKNDGYPGVVIRAVTKRYATVSI